MSGLPQHLASRRPFAGLRRGEMDELVQFAVELLGQAVAAGATRFEVAPGEVAWEGDEGRDGFVSGMDFGPALDLLLERDPVLRDHVELLEQSGDRRTFLIRP
jgi:hypothetical protein